MCKSLMTLHVLELINTSLKEVRKGSEKINHADDFLISESGKLMMKFSMFVLPLVFIVVGYIIYLRKYKISEEFYAEILEDLEGTK